MPPNFCKCGTCSDCVCGVCGQSYSLLWDQVAECHVCNPRMPDGQSMMRSYHKPTEQRSAA